MPDWFYTFICTHILLFNSDVYFIVKLGLNKLKPTSIATHAITLHNYNLTCQT